MPSLEALAQEISEAKWLQGKHPDHPLPTLDWPETDKPKSWWGRNQYGQLTKVYRDYAAYCD